MVFTDSLGVLNHLLIQVSWGSLHTKTQPCHEFFDVTRSGKVESGSLEPFKETTLSHRFRYVNPQQRPSGTSWVGGYHIHKRGYQKKTNRLLMSVYIYENRCLNIKIYWNLLQAQLPATFQIQYTMRPKMGLLCRKYKLSITVECREECKHSASTWFYSVQIPQAITIYRMRDTCLKSLMCTLWTEKTNVSTGE